MYVDIDEYSEQAECVFKNEKYSVRDNGAVFRHARENKSIRKLDNHWTYGLPNNYGYLLIGSALVHRIVAFAFHGEPPTPQHVVDHIDTNRKNNRPENLRWLTKLENVLNNPNTVKKIIFICGSIEAFLNDPSMIKNHERDDRNFSWMRTVTPEEAKISWENISNLKNRDSRKQNSAHKGLGEWVYQRNESINNSNLEPVIILSKTQNALQKNWKTPSEFPMCPQIINESPLGNYYNNIKLEEVFSRNQYNDLIVKDFSISKDKDNLWVICFSSNASSMKPWFLTQVNFENNKFVHISLGSYFKKDGVEKEFIIAQGIEWMGGETFDDLV